MRSSGRVARPRFANALVNSGDGPLRYLCMSTLHPTEVVGYPESSKVAAIAAPHPHADDYWVAKWFPGDANVEYYDGEDTGE